MDGDSLAHTKLTQLCTQDSDSLAHTKVSQLYTRSLRGIGWGSLTSLSFLLSSRHRHCSFMISYRWGGVGQGKNVHVPVHTQAQQPHHLSCCSADTGTALSWSVTGGVGWGGVMTFMSLCTHTGTATSSSFLLSSRHRHCSFMISYRWGGVGRGNNVHVPVRTPAQEPYHLSCCPADTGTAHSWSVTGGLGWVGVG